MSRSNYVHLDNVTILKETEKALLIRLEDGDEHWIPLGQIADSENYTDRVGECGANISITKWIAEQKEIEGEE